MSENLGIQYLSSDSEDAASIHSTTESTSTPVPNSQRQPLKKRRKHAKAIWSYARHPDRSHEPIREKRRRIWYCKYPECAEYSVISTNGARHHMQSKHEIIVKEDSEPSQVKKALQKDLREVYKEQVLKAQSQEEQSTRNTLSAAVNPDTIKQALLRLLILHDLPLNAIEWPQLHTFVHTVNYMALSKLWTTHEAATNAIKRNFATKQKQIKEALQQAKSAIHLCTDTWHSPNRKELQGITAHFVSKEGKLCNTLLAVHDMLASHSSYEISVAVLQTLELYSIKHRLGFITADNASENDTLCCLIADKLDNWEPTEHRLRCFGHIINLAVQAFLFAKSKHAVEYATQLSQATQQDMPALNQALTEDDPKAGWIHAEPLQKVLNFVSELRASDRRYNDFIRLSKGRTIYKPNDTRWNSYFQCFESAYNLQSEYSQFVRLYDEFAQLELTLNDWKVVKETCDLLQPFKEAVKRCEGDYVTLDKVQSSMDYCLSHLRDAKSHYKDNDALSHAIHVAWFAFDKYYNKIDETGAYAAAILLHPSRRKAYLNAAWLPKWIRNGTDRAKELWVQYNTEADVINSAAEEVDGYERWLLSIQAKQRSRGQSDEFTRFIEAPPINIDIPALEWWQLPAQRHAYPQLSNMAIDILSAPAMSAEAERVFSHGRRLIPWTRMSLSATRINQLLCLKHWLQSGLITEHFELDNGQEVDEGLQYELEDVDTEL